MVLAVVGNEDGDGSTAVPRFVGMIHDIDRPFQYDEGKSPHWVITIYKFLF